MSADDGKDRTGSVESWLRKQALLERGRVAGVVLCASGIALLVVLQARLLAQACHRVVVDHAGVSFPLVGAIAVMVAARCALAIVSERQSAAAAAGVKERVRGLLYRRLLALAPSGRAGEETGPLVEAVTEGVESLEPYVARFLPQMFLAALLPLLALCFVLPAEWRAGLVLLFSAPFIPLFMVLIGRGSESLNRRQFRRLSRMAGHLLDLVQGLPDLRLFGAARREAEAVARVSAEYRQATMSVLRIAFLSAFTLEFFATVGTAVVAVIIGFRLLFGHLPLAEGLFVLLLAPEFYLPLRSLGLSYHSRLQGVAAAERIAPLLSMPLPAATAGSLPVPAAPPAVRFDGVTFRYGGDRGGVSGVDLELPAGSFTALAGESGSGKSTLVRLLAGLARPEAGRLTVNGIDLAAIDPDSWRRRVAVVPQQPFFFAGTIRDNLLLGCPTAGDGEMAAALGAAGAAAFVRRLPGGLDCTLGDRGAGLSGGELRRLALARALLRGAFLVVLDEPTAGLDADAERLVLDALEGLAGERTLLVVSHSEATISRAERVAVMSGGRVEGVVPTAQFLAAEGRGR